MSSRCFVRAHSLCIRLRADAILLLISEEELALYQDSDSGIAIRLFEKAPLTNRTA